MRIRDVHKNEEGLAALETALVFPTVMLIVVLIMDLGIFFFDYVNAANAVREGARCGSLGYADGVVSDRVGATAGFPAPTTVDVDRSGGQIGDDIIVTANFDHDWILPASVFGVPAGYQVDSTMRIEALAPPAGGCGS